MQMQETTILALCIEIQAEDWNIAYSEDDIEGFRSEVTLRKYADDLEQCKEEGVRNLCSDGYG